MNPIAGVVIKGHRVASGLAEDSPYPGSTIALQQASFAERGLDLSPFHPGTINISIRPCEFEMVAPEFDLRGVKWLATAPAEDFALSRCQIEHDGRLADGMIYYPRPETKVVHFQDASTIEILAPFLEGLAYGDPVQLTLNTREVLVTAPR